MAKEIKSFVATVGKCNSQAGRIYTPKDWVGKKVQVFLMDEYIRLNDSVVKQMRALLEPTEENAKASLEAMGLKIQAPKAQRLD